MKTGGNNFKICLNEEMKYDFDFSLTFHKDRDASNSAWIGASMLGSLSTFHDLRIKRADYEEHGDNRISFLAKKTF